MTMLQPASRSRALRTTLVFLPALVLGCPATTTGEVEDPLDDFDRSAMLENLADNIIVPAYADFETQSDLLVSATLAYRDAPQDDARRVAAQDAFKVAALSWERAELMQVGPAASPTQERPEGRSLRDEIYSWYQGQNPCAVDQALVADDFSAAGFFDAQLVPKKGLDALAYVLFYEGMSNACSATASINTQGTWAGLDEATLRARRADYAHAAAQHLSKSAEALHQSWRPEGGDFRSDFVSAGDVFGSETEAMDALFASMFYVELRSKDRKLAVPLGLHMDCATVEGCPDDEELHHTGLSRQALIANFETFRDLFTGKDGIGFDDALVAAEAAELSDTMLGHLDEILVLLRADDRTIAELVQTDHAAGIEIYDAVKRFTDDFKSQFVSVLNLSVPQEGAGDND